MTFKLIESGQTRWRDVNTALAQVCQAGQAHPRLYAQQCPSNHERSLLAAVRFLVDGYECELVIAHADSVALVQNGAGVDAPAENMHSIGGS
jgi:hypothetical protein